jgi:hypothetical protein
MRVDHIGLPSGNPRLPAPDTCTPKGGRLKILRGPYKNPDLIRGPRIKSDCGAKQIRDCPMRPEARPTGAPYKFRLLSAEFTG